MRTRQSLALAAAFAFMTLAWVRCGTQLGGSGSTTIQPTLSSIYSNVVVQNCQQCHSPAGSATAHNSTLDFTSQSSTYSTLIGNKVTATSSVGNCGSVSLVKASSPAQSYLVAEIVYEDNLASSSCHSLYTQYYVTPFAGTANCTPYTGHSFSLSCDEQNAIISWIQNGAANN